MVRDYLGRLRLLSRDSRLIIASTSAIYFSSFGLVTVVLNLYLLRLGYDAGFIGLVQGAGFLAGTAACLPAAEIGRRWGTRRTAIAGLAANTLLWTLMPASLWVPPAMRREWLVAVYALICIGGWGLVSVSLGPLFMDATTPAERNHAFSLMNGAGAAFGFLGALAGGQAPALAGRLLGRSLSDAAPYALALAVTPLAWALAALLIRATAPSASTAPAADRAGAEGRAPVAVFLAMAAVSVTVAAGTSSITTFFNVYMDGALRASTGAIGATIAVSKLLAVPAALLAPLALARLGGGRTYIAAHLGVTASVVLLSLVPTPAVAAGGYLAMAALMSLAAPGFSVLQLQVVSHQWRPTMSAVGNISFTLGSAALAFGGGQLIVTLGYRALFLA